MLLKACRGRAKRQGGIQEGEGQRKEEKRQRDDCRSRRGRQGRPALQLELRAQVRDNTDTAGAKCRKTNSGALCEYSMSFFNLYRSTGTHAEHHIKRYRRGLQGPAHGQSVPGVDWR